MRLLICGDRNWTDSSAVTEVVERLRPEVVIEGDARGADRMAGIAGELAGAEVEVYPAEWDKFGRAAGVIRNQRMLDYGEPTHVIAFHDDLANSRGTRDMVNRALKAKIPVLHFSHANGLQEVKSVIK